MRCLQWISPLLLLIWLSATGVICPIHASRFVILSLAASRLWTGQQLQPTSFLASGKQQQRQQGDGQLDYSSTMEALLHFTNVERRQSHLNNLAFHNELAKAAQFHANDMLRHDYFSHTSQSNGLSKLSDRVQSLTKYRYHTVGENLFLCSPYNNPQDAVQGWMNSRGHRKNLLHPDFTEIGLGYATNGERHYYLQVFGQPLAYPAPASPQATRESLYHLTNQVRRQKNKAPLHLSTKLHWEAQDRAESMARSAHMNNNIPHTTAVLDHYCRLGIHVTCHEPFNDPYGAIESWLKSRSSYILDDNFCDVGLGYASSKDQRKHYYVQLFGLPKGSVAAAKQQKKHVLLPLDHHDWQEDFGTTTSAWSRRRNNNGWEGYSNNNSFDWKNTYNFGRS